MKRKCPNCKKQVDWKSQIMSWMKNYGTKWMGWSEIMIVCEKCGKYVGIIDLTEGKIKTELVTSPALKKKVAVPII